MLWLSMLTCVQLQAWLAARVLSFIAASLDLQAALTWQDLHAGPNETSYRIARELSAEMLPSADLEIPNLLC
jgi:hypothetical protein